MARLVLLASIAAACAACAATRYALPMTASQLAGSGEGGALVAYLGQPDASAAVCEAGAPGQRLATADGGVRRALFRAFGEGRIPPGIWRRCVDALLRAADPETAAALLDDVVQFAAAAIADPDLETDPGAQDRLDAIQGLFLEREAEAPSPGANRRMVATIEGKLGPPPMPTLTDDARAGPPRPLGPVGRRKAAELLAIADLEQGRWQGRPVDVPLLDGLLQAGDEEALRWCSARLSDAPLRAEARRRLVRLRLQASPFPEVRLDAAAVEEAVLRLGSNPVSLGEHAPVRGWLDAARVPARRVVVEQRVEEQVARLLGDAPDRPAVSILPEVPLRGGLQVELGGISRPVTVCGPARELDVSPCLAPGDLHAQAALARVDPDGVLRFADALGEAAAVGLARGGRTLAVPIAAGGRGLAALEWPLAFRTTGDLVLQGAGPGGRGPDLRVEVDRRDPWRLIYAVAAPAGTYQAVVEWADVPSFQVVSRGGAGESGSAGLPGSDGASGMSGASASCPSPSPGQDGQPGGNGGPGGAGGPGGPGGDGGDIRVTLVSAAGAREETLQILRATVRSEGGPGGAGGSGGRGGSGGSGGSGGFGAACWDGEGHFIFLSGGASGASGSSGSPGPDGPSGQPGRPGRVIFSGG